MTAVTASDLTAKEPTEVDVPLVNSKGGKGLTVAPGLGADVSARLIEGTSANEDVTQLAFDNRLAERRIAALEGVPAGAIEGARALVLDYRLAMGQGNAPPIVVLFFENDGGVWYRTSSKWGVGSQFSEIRLPLKGAFTRAVFATDADETIRWEQVETIWLGLLVTGPSAGALEVRQVRFTAEPLRPDSPVALGTSWDIAQDSAVESKLDVKSQVAGGGEATDYRFNLPGGRHMFAMIRTPIDVDELDGYSGLQFTYRAKLPESIRGLLIMLIEGDGTQYRAVSPPPASDEWQTVTIPFEGFERGGWSKDENDQLDLEDVSHLSIGMHGTTPAASLGTIQIRDVRILP